MKKLLAFSLLVAFVCGMAFADEDGEESDGKFLNVQVGASIMYKQPIGTSIPFSFYYFRGGVTADILFSLGIIEIGAEVGAYGMSDDWGFFIFELPLDALVRLNFSKDRSFAIEVRGGGWFMSVGSLSEFGFNAGARLVANIFYIGADYIMTGVFFYPAWTVEAGVKFSF